MRRDFFLPRRGAAYVATVILAGGTVIGVSAAELLSSRPDPGWLLLAALTLLSGSATVRLPSVPATISISETFVFTSVLLFGPAAGATIVALDGLIISFWFARKRKDIYRVAFNMAAPALSIWVSAQLYFSFPEVTPLAAVESSVKIQAILIPLLVFTLCHFLANSWLIAQAVALETERRAFDIWRGEFLWLSLNYFGGASVAALLVVYTRELHWTYLGIIIPLLLILYFTFKIPMARVEDANRHLQQVNSLYLSTIETLALAIDAKDQVTHGHIRRVQTFANSLAKAIGLHDELMLKAIEASALLHDMGKLAIPEHILNKPGKLTDAEFEKMKLHATIGADILSSIEFPYPVVPIVRHHHENWDGTGYPAGLSGVEIPIGARILSVVDCFDALTSDRPYRPALSDQAALTILKERRGTMYDPLVVDTFIRIHNELRVTDIADEPKALPGCDAMSHTEAGTAQTSTAPPDELGVFLLHQTINDFQERCWADASDLVVHRLSQVVPVSKCLVFEYDAADDDLVCRTSYGRGMEGAKHTRRKLGQGLSGWVGANRRCIVNSSPALDIAPAASVGFVGLESTLCVPLVVHDSLVGVLTLYSSEPHAYTDYHRELVESIGPRIARLIKRSQLLQLANEPVMQGYPGSYHLDTYLRQRFQGAEGKDDLCLLVLQLAAFPTPEQQRRCLDSALASVEKNLRGGDIVFVCDETTLVYVLSNANEAEAQLVRSRLAVNLNHNGLARSGVSNIALLVAPRDGRTLDQLLTVATRSFATLTDASRSQKEGIQRHIS